MTPERLREIAANCEDTSFIASEDNARELRALADDLELSAANRRCFTCDGLLPCDCGDYGSVAEPSRPVEAQHCLCVNTNWPITQMYCSRCTLPIRRATDVEVPAPPVDTPANWLIAFEDPEKEPLSFTGYGAELAARSTFQRVGDQWACHLFAEVASTGCLIPAPNYPVIPDSSPVPAKIHNPEIFVAEYEDGSLVDNTGDGGWSAWFTSAEAQDAADNDTDNPSTVVRYVRDAPAVPDTPTTFPATIRYAGRGKPRCFTCDGDPCHCDEEISADMFESPVDAPTVATTQSATRERKLPKFDDSSVQSVYELLCGGLVPPEGEHWEGFIARHIVAKLRAPEVDTREREWRLKIEDAVSVRYLKVKAMSAEESARYMSRMVAGAAVQFSDDEVNWVDADTPSDKEKA